MNAPRATRIATAEKISYAGPVIAALLSLGLGIVVAAVLLVMQPVNRVKVMPKEAERIRGAVYFIEGNRDAARARSASEKIQSLLRGQLVTFSEEDFNALLEAAFAAKAKAAPDAVVAPGTPNVRIRDGRIQFASELTWDLWGEKKKVLLQTRGTLREDAGGWVFEPSEMWLGSLPLSRVPFATGWVRTHFLDPRQFHPDLAMAWSKLGRVILEDSVIKVSLR